MTRATRLKFHNPAMTISNHCDAASRCRQSNLDFHKDSGQYSGKIACRDVLDVLFAAYLQQQLHSYQNCHGTI
jgi:hypothetical protein